jgi:orotidine-5'-phosphate decarboxylase
MPQSPLIVALDYEDPSRCLQLVDQLNPEQVRLKVGKELFTTAGPAIVEALQTRGFEVFLDLKFHDIPNTVAKAVSAAARLGVWMVNVHASGGERMLVAAREAVDATAHRPLLIGVTVLTSMTAEDLRNVGVSRAPEEQVMHLAKMVQQSGLDGVVCSARESAKLKQDCGQGFALVTPGIRPAGSDANDQRRTLTPAKALTAGSDYLVIGRPITAAADPARACEEIIASLKSASPQPDA